MAPSQGRTEQKDTKSSHNGACRTQQNGAKLMQNSAKRVQIMQNTAKRIQIDAERGKQLRIDAEHCKTGPNWSRTLQNGSKLIQNAAKRI